MKGPTEKQKKPKKALLAEGAYGRLAQVHSELNRPLEDLLRSHGLTPVTYNVLRILRDAGPRGLACGEVADRMWARVPDVTRLIDRLVRLGVVQRFRTDQDRRRVYQSLTSQGLNLAESLEGPVRGLYKSGLGQLSRGELQTLTSLLERIRQVSVTNDSR